MKPLPEDETPKRKTSFTEALAGALSIIVIIILCLCGIFMYNKDLQEYRDRGMEPSPTLDERLKMLESGVNTFEGNVYEVDGGLVIRRIYEKQ